MLAYRLDDEVLQRAILLDAQDTHSLPELSRNACVQSGEWFGCASERAPRHGLTLHRAHEADLLLRQQHAGDAIHTGDRMKASAVVPAPATHLALSRRLAATGGRAPTAPAGRCLL